MKVFAKITGVCGLLLCVAFAQPIASGNLSSNYLLQTWGASDGLGGNVILSIAQTPDGYLWIGTTHGVSRFDGVRFQNFLTRRMPHRVGTRVEALDVDKLGRLWIVAEQKGILVFERHQLRELHTNSPALESPTVSVRSDRHGNVWIVDQQGKLARVDGTNPERIEAVEFKLPPGTQLFRDGKGNVWAAGGRFISRHLAGNWVNVLRTDATVQAVGAGREGGLWLAMADRLHRLHEHGGLEELETFPWRGGAAVVTSLFEDDQGVLWIGTSVDGLYRRANGQLVQALATPRSLRCLTRDSEGNLWIGTRGNGLARVGKRIFQTVDARAGLPSGFIKSLTEDAFGRIWLATEEQGLGWFADGKWNPARREHGWPGVVISCVARGRNDDVWIATMRQGLWHWRSNQFTRVRLNTRMPGGSPRCLHEDRTGTLWVVIDDVALVSISNQVVTVHNSSNGLDTRRVRTILEDADGKMWAGDWRGGIWRFDSERWETVREPNSHTEAVRAMVADDNGDLWIGTADAGLFRVRGRQISRIDDEHGLIEKHIQQILLHEGVLWFGTENGFFHAPLARLNEVADGKRSQLEVTRHGPSEGLPELHFAGQHQPRSWRTERGELWFATANGALHFFPSQLASNVPLPRVQIEEVLVNGRQQPSEKTLHLRASARRLEFHFTVPTFTAPERVRFRYQLTGMDDDWVECGSERSATYASVPFGTHVFRVAAANAGGEWGTPTESMALVVQPFFWQTQWFVALVAAALTGGAVWMARWATLLRLRRKLQLVEQQHALERERARISQDIHDELGANLTTIGLMADLGRRHRSDTEAVMRDLAQISEVARGTATKMDAIVWALNPRNDSLDHFANYIGQFTKDFLRPTTIRTRLDIPASLPVQPMSANARHNLFLVVKEALNNVVRHSGAGELRLALRLDNGSLQLSVQDDGKGLPERPPADNQNGLANMRARVEKIGGSMMIEPAPNGGTRLIFSVPLAKLNHN